MEIYDAVFSWFEQGQDYDYDSDACYGVCDSYTQVSFKRSMSTFEPFKVSLWDAITCVKSTSHQQRCHLVKTLIGVKSPYHFCSSIYICSKF